MINAYTARGETIHVRLNKAELRALDEIALDEGRSKSDVMRRLMAEALTARNERKAP